MAEIRHAILAHFRNLHCIATDDNDERQVLRLRVYDRDTESDADLAASSGGDHDSTSALHRSDAEWPEKPTIAGTASPTTCHNQVGEDEAKHTSGAEGTSGGRLKRSEHAVLSQIDMIVRQLVIRGVPGLSKVRTSSAPLPALAVTCTWYGAVCLCERRCPCNKSAVGR